MYLIVEAKKVNIMFLYHNYIEKIFIHSKVFYFGFIFCVLMLPSAFSQNDSLMTYLTIAAKNNPDVLQKYYEYESTLQKIPQVSSLPDPEVSMGVFFSPMELVAGNQVADIKLMQMFPWWGTLKAAKDEMSLMAKSRYEAFRESKLKVFFEVQQSWNELYKLHKNMQLIQTYLRILEIIEQLAITKYETSTGVKFSSSTQVTSINKMQEKSTQPSSSNFSEMNMDGNNSNAVNSMQSTKMPMTNSSMPTASMEGNLADIYRIEIEISELKENLQELIDKYATESARFNELLNRPPQMQISIPDTLMPDTLNVILQTITDTILNNNPMLGMWRYEQQSLEARKRMVTRMGYPMLGIGLNYSVINKNPMSTSAMNGSDMIMPMVTITLPIYRKKYKAMQSEVELLQQAAQESYTSTLNRLRTDYYKALQQYNSSYRKINLYQLQGDLAKRSLELQITNFTNSGNGLAEILRTWQQALNYQIKQIEAVADFNTAIARFRQIIAIQLVE